LTDRYLEHDCPGCGQHTVADIHIAAQVALALRIAGAFRCWRCHTIADLDSVGGVVYSAPRWIVVCQPCLAGMDTVDLAKVTQ
jgi:hypothetical protein